MRVWITRTQPQAAATAERIRVLGHEPIVSPVLVSEPLEGVFNLQDVGALAFTSANAVSAFARTQTRRDLMVFTVGRGTQQAALDAGFSRVISADGDGAALARLIGASFDPASGVVLHPAAEEPAYDLVSELEARGIQARKVTAYRTIPAEPTAELAAALRGEAPPIDAMLIHSPRGAARVAELLDGAMMKCPAVFAISPAAAAALLALAGNNIATAEFPDEASVLRLLPRQDQARSPGMSDMAPLHTDQDGEPPVDDRLSPEPPRKVLGPLFWIFIIFGVLCVLIGFGIATLGPRLYPPARTDTIVAPR